jgi:hypothetical protein
MSEHAQRKRKGKRLLVAAIGVATASYVGSSGCNRAQVGTATSGNLMAPPPAEAAVPSPDGAGDAEPIQPSGNLMAPPQDAAQVEPAVPEIPQATGNLMPPPPAKPSATKKK